MNGRNITKLLLFAGICASPARSEDWPRWRGPRGDGSWRGPSAIAPFDLALTPRWEQPLGGGYSGISIVDGRVYTMDRPGDPQSATTERVLCFDAQTGKPLWAHEYPALYEDLDYGSGPRGNPTIHEGRVYTLGAVGMACCLDAKTGAVFWSHDTVKRFGARRPTWGFAASPLIVGDTVVFHVGAEPNGSLLAIDPQTGAEVWRSLPDPAGYCTPIRCETPSGPQLILWTPENVHGVDPDDGTPLWSIPYEIRYGVSIATPIYADGLVFITGYWEEGSKAIRLGPGRKDATIAWENRDRLRGLMAPPLYKDGYVYSLDKQFGVTCFRLETGEIAWNDSGHALTPRGRNPQLTMVWIGDGDDVLIVNSEGELLHARFTPEGFEERSRTKIIDPTWANPGFAGDAVFARSDTRLVCVPLPTR